MPDNSAEVKVHAVRSFGATADLINVREVSRTERLAQLANERPDAYLASAFDDQLVIDGNATLGDELAELGFDSVIVPVGGGGLSSGLIQSFARKGVATEVFGAEPLMANDAADPACGRTDRQRDGTSDDRRRNTYFIAGAPELAHPERRGRGYYRGYRRTHRRGVEAVLRFRQPEMRTDRRPSLAAMLEQPERFEGKKVCLVVSGGNVDPALYAQLLTGK